MKVFHFDSYKSNSVIQTVHSSYCESLEDFNRKLNESRILTWLQKHQCWLGSREGSVSATLPVCDGERAIGPPASSLRAIPGTVFLLHLELSGPL